MPRTLRSAAEGHTHASALPARATVTYTTASLASTARELGSFAGFAGYRVLSVTTSRPARVRLYDDAGSQTADAGRVVGTDPTGDHGVQFDYVTVTGQLVWSGAPPVDCQLSTGTTAPITVDNLDTVTGVVTVTLVLLKTE